MKPTRIVIIGKAPIPGFTKTRLIPAIGIDGATDLARRMFEHTVRIAINAQVGAVELCVTPSLHDPTWKTLDIPANVVWTEQGDGDLGARMARAAHRTIINGEAVLLIGTDCPELSVDHLTSAAAAFADHDSTLVPTTDGGYALLGLTRFHPILFDEIPWSTDEVAFETLCRLCQIKWTVKTHRMLHDIDKPDDLKWLPKVCGDGIGPAVLATWPDLV